MVARSGAGVRRSVSLSRVTPTAPPGRGRRNFRRGVNPGTLRGAVQPAVQLMDGNPMLFRLAVFTTLLATASVASAQARPAVGTVYYKNATDCADMKDDNGTPVCVMSSLGGSWIMDAPYRTVTSMKLPYGRY